MTLTSLETPAFSRRDSDMICWRVSAIHRCCIKLDMSKEWAVEKLREICPKGHRDHMADVWFAAKNSVQSYEKRILEEALEESFDLQEAEQEAASLEESFDLGL